jgi:hypothetical protein
MERIVIAIFKLLAEDFRMASGPSIEFTDLADHFLDLSPGMILDVKPETIGANIIVILAYAALMISCELVLAEPRLIRQFVCHHVNVDIGELVSDTFY